MVNKRISEETRKKNRERSLADYYAHKSERNKYSREWYWNHKEEYQEDWKILKQKVIDHYSSGTMICNRCGIGDIRVLSIDHIKGDGAKHRREIGGHMYALYHWLIDNNYPEGFQVLCYNCQIIKRIENNEVRKYYDEFGNRQCAETIEPVDVWFG